MPDTDPCELCQLPARPIGVGGYDGIAQECRRCGRFRISGTGIAIIRCVSQRNKAKLSSWVQEQNLSGEIPELDSRRIRLIEASPVPGVVAQADKLLTRLVQSQDQMGALVSLDDPSLIAITHSLNDNDVYFLRDFLVEQGFATEHPNRSRIRITPKGLMRAEELRSKLSASEQGFIAMWFDPSMSEYYTSGLEAGVRRAGYRPRRVDRVEHVNKIDDEIVAQIRQSRFVVADFTGQRGGVYFEAGFAMGLNLPVIWTCRRDDVSNLHFDIRQFNCIDWADGPELAVRLQNRIEAVIGKGPLPSIEL